MLYYEHFSGSQPSRVESARDQTFKHMILALRSSVINGLLFSGGNAGLFTDDHRNVIGEEKSSVCFF